MEYAKISTVLKRYSFDDKMRIANHFSRKTYTYNGLVDCNQLMKIPHPWELETYVLLSIKALEWQYNKFSGNNDRVFGEIITAIRKELPAFFETVHNDESVMWIFATHSAVQFDLQEFYPFKLYRFNYFFSFKNESIDMEALFREKFGCEYYDFLLLGWILWVCFVRDDFSPEQFNDIINFFPTPVSYLTISRQAYVDNLDTIADNPEHYLYCLRPSYVYPFVEYKGKVYCPLPHLILRATTSSLMHRLTDGSNELMKDIGKEVYEKYLYDIINESGIFDEILAEREYIYRRQTKRTADVMARKGDDYVFFDSKSFTPKAAIRNFSEEALEKDISRLAEACAQLYKHIRYRFPNEYCFFEKKPDQSAYNIFGIVIIQEDSYIKSDKIYLEAAQILNIPEKSPEFEWLFKHVGLATIHSVERYCFTSTNLCPDLHKILSEHKPNHSWLTNDSEATITHEKYRSFTDRLVEDEVKVIMRMK